MLKWHASHELVDCNAIERVDKSGINTVKASHLHLLGLSEALPSRTLPPADHHAFLLFAGNEFILKQLVLKFLQNL